eukprot:1190974-Prorocentrum_minimum.AAC.2
MDRFELPHHRHGQEHLAAAGGWGSSFVDAQLKTLLNANVFQQGKRHRTKRIHTWVHRVGEADERLEEVTQAPRCPAVVHQAPSTGDDSRPIPKTSSRLVNLNVTSVGDALKQPQEVCLKILQPRVFGVLPNRVDPYRFSREGSIYYPLSKKLASLEF